MTNLPAPDRSEADRLRGLFKRLGVEDPAPGSTRIAESRRFPSFRPSPDGSRAERAPSVMREVPSFRSLSDALEPAPESAGARVAARFWPLPEQRSESQRVAVGMRQVPSFRPLDPEAEARPARRGAEMGLVAWRLPRLSVERALSSLRKARAGQVTASVAGLMFVAAMMVVALNPGGMEWLADADSPTRIIGYVPDGKLAAERRADDPFALDREIASDAVGGRAVVSRPIPPPASVGAPSGGPELATLPVPRVAPEQVAVPEPEATVVRAVATRVRTDEEAVSRVLADEEVVSRPERRAVATRPFVDPALEELRRQARAAVLAARVPGFVAPARPRSPPADMPATIGVMASDGTTDGRAARLLRQDATDAIRAIRLR